MKRIYLTFIIIALSTLQLSVNQLSAQSRFNLPDNPQQQLSISTGLDYAVLPLTISYKKGLRLFGGKRVISAGVEAIVPMFNFDLNDLKLSLTTEMTLYKSSRFEVSGGLNPLYVSTKLETNHLRSLGADLHLFAGYSSPNWHLGLDFMYNKIFSTYITHSDIYRDNVFADVVDGWYRNTASNIKIGIYASRTFGNFDPFLTAGIVKTGKFNDFLLVPGIYLNLGTNFRF